MSPYSSPTLWAIILISAAGTYLLRWSFLGGLGARGMPDWAARMLRYTAVAVLPGLIAPLVLWPQATGGQPDPARLAAAAAALAVGVMVRNLLASLGAGIAVFAGMTWLLG